ncbi:UDP-glucose 6-dehydrogenase [Synergistales bacterium]|nr:UDP-glucose 6-dehydrogenase [Synergistales bacterium]GHV50948.1 UDP-glucose 6-dehydrogenase [Synergistales bacterium]
MNICVVGTGYVGLVTGSCFADKGNKVWCVDIDEKRVAMLKRGESPIYEEGLAEMITRNSAEGRLFFSTDIADGLTDADLCFIAVGTPPTENGETDLAQVLSVADSIGLHIRKGCFIVVKSTVPVGTGRLVCDKIGVHLRERGIKAPVEILSNPEFLKEGRAIHDCLNPDRVVVGAVSEEAKAAMRELYSSFVEEDRIIFMDPASAEITKYAANAMLAVRISFMNEIARLCDAVGGDVSAVRSGIASDRRIGEYFLNAGCGYGGSCFPKDVQSLCRVGEGCGVEMTVTSAIEKVNRNQKRVLPIMVRRRFGQDLTGLNIAVLGLAFKPGTDDMREAPSITLINDLVEHGADITAFDPIAEDNAKSVLPGSVKYARSAGEAITGADAAVLVAEWPEFGSIDWARAGSHMKGKILFDGRNMYEPQTIKNLGFEYYCIGRNCAVR